MIVIKQYLCLITANKAALHFRVLVTIGLILIVLLTLSNPFWFGFFLFGDDVGTYFSARESNETSASDKRNAFKLSKHEVHISEIYPNCGIRYQCPDNTFPAHIYTGQDKDDQPKLCVGGKYVSGGGRGLNIAIIESKHLQLVSLENFDLYSHNSSTLEAWLENDLHEDDIIIAFTFDEASKELSNKAKAILYNLGSGKIQDLQFRSQWYMISQKGINGFTPLENITYAKNDHWGEVIDERICVPRRIKPMTVSPNPVPRKNPLREKLCSESEELSCEDFCNALARHEPIMPSLLTNRSYIGNLVFATPVIVVASKELASLVLTLETLIFQPGVHAGSVVVVYEEHQEHVPTLSKIFGFLSAEFNGTNLTSPRNAKIEFGLKYVSEHYPKKKYVVVIEEDLILSPDFLFYMAQMVLILEKDNSLLGVSAWNPYGYEGISGDPYRAYRVQDFPGLAFLIPIRLYQQYMHRKMHLCCNQGSFRGWNSILEANKGSHMIIPDVSRVLKRPKAIYDRQKCDSEFYMFTKPRVTNVEDNVWIERPNDLVRDRYFQHMASLVQSSITFYLTRDDLKLCENGSNIAITTMLHELTHKVFSVYFQEKSCHSQEVLKAHMKCFGIFVPNDMKVQNLYEKVLRLSINTNVVFLIDSTSPFAKNKRSSQFS